MTKILEVMPTYTDQLQHEKEMFYWHHDRVCLKLLNHRYFFVDHTVYSHYITAGMSNVQPFDDFIRPGMENVKHTPRGPDTASLMIPYGPA